MKQDVKLVRNPILKWIISWPISLYLLNKIFFMISKLPYSWNNVLIMAWILKNTPDNDEHK